MKRERNCDHWTGKPTEPKIKKRSTRQMFRPLFITEILSDRIQQRGIVEMESERSYGGQRKGGRINNKK